MNRIRKSAIALFPGLVSLGLFLSGLFTMIAPLPLGWVGFRLGWIRGLLVLLINTALLYGITRSLEISLLYGVAMGWVAFSLLFFVRRDLRKSRGLRPEWTVGKVFFGLVVMAVGCLAFWVHQSGLPIRDWYAAEMKELSIIIERDVPLSTRQEWLGETPLETWLERSPFELVATTGSLMFLLAWLNFVLASSWAYRLQVAVAKAQDTWKLSEYWLIPIIGSWGFALLGPEALRSWGWVGLRLLALPFGIQGISVLSVWLRAKGFGSFFRMVFYMSILSLMAPVVAVLGLVDVWFDFRARVRQI